MAETPEDRNTLTPEQWALIKAEAIRRGYRYEESKAEVRLIRPDGTVAVYARRRPSGAND